MPEGLPILLDDILDRLKIVAAFFQEISGQLVEIDLSNVDALAASTTRHKIFFRMSGAHERHLASALACADESRYTQIKKSKKRKRLDHNRRSC